MWEWALDKLLPNVPVQEHESCGWLQQASWDGRTSVVLNCDNVYCGQITRRVSNYYFILVAQLTISHCAGGGGGGGGVISARARPRLTLSVGILLFCPPSALASPHLEPPVRLHLQLPATARKKSSGQCSAGWGRTVRGNKRQFDGFFLETFYCINI